MDNTRGKRIEMMPVDEVITKVVAPKNKKGTVTCFKLNVREAPSIESAIYSVISENDVVEILDDMDNTWYKVRFDGVVTGFCMKEFIKVG